MKRLILIMLFCSLNVSAIHINEIMYNPQGNDNNKEYVEIYMDNFTSLENWTIADSDSNDTLSTLSQVNSSYALIVEEGFNYTGVNCSIYSAGATIGNNLNNDGDAVLLYNDSLIDITEYNSSGQEDHSLSLIQDTWEYTYPGTPCQPNKIPDAANYSNTTNSSKQNLTQSPGNASSCPLSLNTTTDKTIYEEGEKVKIRHNVGRTKEPFYITYWIETLSGEIEKSKHTTENTNEKRWTASSDEKALLVKSVITSECNKTPLSMQKLIAVNSSTTENVKEKAEYETTITAAEFEEAVQFGEILTPKVSITKGDTNKYSISAYVKGENSKVSKTTKLHIYKKNSENTIQLPVALTSNCNQRHAPGEYQLIIEGLGEKISKPIYISENNKCQEKIIYKNKTIEKNTPQIKSFYTLKKNFASQINLFATFENVDEPHSIALYGQKDVSYKNITNNSKTTLTANVTRGKNIIVLDLLKNNQSKDTKFLQITFPSNETTKEKQPVKNHENN
ncbi:MAG: lamin tail domain-containing protein, partial [Nanoarchaeota archaeon]